MIQANPTTIYLDATSLVTFNGTAYMPVNWLATGGTVNALSAATDAQGNASAVFTPNAIGTAIVSVQHAV